MMLPRFKCYIRGCEQTVFQAYRHVQGWNFFRAFNSIEAAVARYVGDAYIK